MCKNPVYQKDIITSDSKRQIHDFSSSSVRKVKPAIQRKVNTLAFSEVHPRETPQFLSQDEAQRALLSPPCSDYWSVTSTMFLKTNELKFRGLLKSARVDVSLDAYIARFGLPPIVGTTSLKTIQYARIPFILSCFSSWFSDATRVTISRDFLRGPSPTDVPLRLSTWIFSLASSCNWPTFSSPF